MRKVSTANEGRSRSREGGGKRKVAQKREAHTRGK